MSNSKLHSKGHSLFLQGMVSHFLAFTENASQPRWQRLAGLILACAALGSGNAFGGRVSDIRGTKHNLSAEAAGTFTAFGGQVPTRTVKATTETQVCAFCHTPHGATLGLMPLWNRKLSSQTYTPYASSSLDANVIQGTLGQPGGSSKLCLSCHDGTLAIGSVNVLNGLGSATPGTQVITMEGTDPGGVMPAGSDGYTRNLGIDLTNDHPISVDYTAALASRDGELRSVDANQKYPAGTGTIIGVRRPGYNPRAPLEPTGVSGVGQIQCAACHDPHLRETDAKVGNQKFLILNRFQEQVNPAPNFDSLNDIGCVACHDKDQNQGVWKYSAHANQLVAIQTYSNAAANQREFPTAAGDGAATNLPVWKASCLNCHDTHTAQGSRWLLRGGTTAGGKSAIEETCYQCHSSNVSNINNAIEPLTNMPDIKTEFALSRHMPITLADQGNIATEVHDIGGNFNDTGFVDCSGLLNTNSCGANFVEQRAKLGVGNLSNRHAECTDCHNPHRVVKFNSLVGNGGSLAGTPDATGTHKHTDAAGYTHTNIASGALRGTFGVEPVYTSASFGDATHTGKPVDYTVKFGDPKMDPGTDVSKPYVTREYQICLKCHSDYGYDDNNAADATSNRPSLGSTINLTPNPTNGLTHYTNQAKEFQAPLAHMGEVTTSDSGAVSPTYSTNNHRSWHPVMDVTGRTLAITGAGATAYNLPWRNAGTQTMYCSDCHGSSAISTTSVIPDVTGGMSWGPHGSGNDFIPKGAWNSSTGDSAAGKAGTTDICFKCHDYNSYALGVAAAAAAGGVATGFKIAPLPNTDVGAGTDGHQLHVDRILLTNPANKGTRCTWCHVAVPHGWKNKGLLVNLNDVGLEAGHNPSTEERNNTTAAYNAAPYYLNAVLKVKTFAASGQWKASDCGSSGVSGNGQVGLAWMKTSNENCTTPP